MLFLILVVIVYVYGHDVDATDKATIETYTYHVFKFTCQETCLANRVLEPGSCHVKDITIGPSNPNCDKCIDDRLRRSPLVLWHCDEEIKLNEWQWMRYAHQIQSDAHCSPVECDGDEMLNGNFNGLKCIGYKDWERANFFVEPSTDPISAIAKEWKKIVIEYQEITKIFKTIPANICSNLYEKNHPIGYQTQQRKNCLDQRMFGLVAYISHMPGSRMYEKLRKRYPLGTDGKCDTFGWFIHDKIVS